MARSFGITGHQLESTEKILDFSGIFCPIESNFSCELRSLLEFNLDMDSNASLTKLNERYLELRMEELDRHHPENTELYELTRVRLHELLLICAANYANCCEYKAAGDLLVNPRLALVHVRGFCDPIVKERHRGLTEQFSNVAGAHSDVIRWLKEETTLHIEKTPLIPHSYGMIEKCGFVSKAYLDSAQGRAQQIAGLIAFLFSGGFKDGLKLQTWLKRASTNDRVMVESKLIRLDWKIFNELGHQIYFMIDNQRNPKRLLHKNQLL